MLYRNLGVNAVGHLTISGQDTVQLATRFGSPLMVLDESVIRARCRIYRTAMEQNFPAGSIPLYASKALSFKRLYQIMAEEGLGVDVVSCGELYTAEQAGFPLERVCFHGNNKTDEDIRFAMDRHIGLFVCDNADELEVINREAARRGIVQKILLRLTPGIDPHTHKKINTGRIDSKFGVPIETGQAEQLVRQALSMPHVELCGYHCHIGSQIFDCRPFCDAAQIMLRFLSDIKRRHGHQAAILNLGGGMGVPYTENDTVVDYAANLRLIGEQVKASCAQLDLDEPVVLIEPGRSLVADAGVTLYTVGSIKTIPGFLNYVSIDGGMTDNPRYALYQSDYTSVCANRMNERCSFRCTVAGRCCESGDIIQERVSLPSPRRGDLLAVLTTGAYNYSMASNYNRLPRPAIVMVGSGKPEVVVRRETLDDLIAYDL